MPSPFAFHVPLPLTRSSRRYAHQKSASPPNIPVAVMNPAKTYYPEDFIRPELKRMPPYRPILPYDILADKLGRDPSDIVKLDANENPFGAAPSVSSALAGAKYLHIYPDPESTYLREAISAYTAVPKEYILAGAGADELIDLLFRLFVTPAAGHSIINCPPTFGMYKFDADVNGCNVINVPRRPDFTVDVDAIEATFREGENPKMIFIASPNNPDGSVLSDSDLSRLLALPTLVVLDEAYFEFAEDNRLNWVPKHENLVVLRTFSKWAGLAGMRVGYGAFPLPIIKHLWKIKQPYNVGVASQIAAIASIEERDDLLSKVHRMVQLRDVFYQRIANLDWLRPYPSKSNYVLCRVGNGRHAEQVKDELEKRGILIRYYSTKELSDCIRVSMGTEEQMERLYAALDEM